MNPNKSPISSSNSPRPNFHQALDWLREGNQRFVRNSKLNRDLLGQVSQTSQGQSPFAAILSCMDSRTPAELIFDLGIGDVFSIRIAGHVISPNVLGSLEYATAVMESPLILILGHSQCGAVRGACDGVQMGHLTALLEGIHPAIAQENTIQENRHGGNSEFVQKVSKIHSLNTLESILDQSPLIRQRMEQGLLGLVPAMYHIDCGKVEFFSEHTRFGPPQPHWDALPAPSA